MQGDLLALLYLNPDHEYSLSEAARQCRTSVKTLHPEVNRLSKAGLIDERRLGNLRMLRAGDPGPIRQPLTQLLAATYGPIPVLERELATVKGIERTYIYGSWAARHGGVEGPPPNDVDVLAVGTVDRDEVLQAAERAQDDLRREVNVAVVTVDSWSNPDGDPFLQSVQGSHLVELDLRDEAKGPRS